MSVIDPMHLSERFGESADHATRPRLFMVTPRSPRSPRPDRREIKRLGRLVKLSAPGAAGSQAASSEMDRLAGQLERRIQASSQTLALKRAMDIAGAVIGLFIAAPLMVLIALAIRLTSPGPAMFAQLRHGIGQRPFQLFKFRTMYWHVSDVSGVAQTKACDPRITPLGRFLRRTNLDELPQLWNVLRGDMSLVGPRPHPIGIRGGGMPYDELVLIYPLRHMVKPGLTGLAQMRGLRGSTADRLPARLRILCDLAYVSNFSVLLDLKIFFLTIRREFGGRVGTGS